MPQQIIIEARPTAHAESTDARLEIGTCPCGQFAAYKLPLKKVLVISEYWQRLIPCPGRNASIVLPNGWSMGIENRKRHPCAVAGLHEGGLAVLSYRRGSSRYVGRLVAPHLRLPIPVSGTDTTISLAASSACRSPLRSVYWEALLSTLRVACARRVMSASTITVRRAHCLSSFRRADRRSRRFLDFLGGHLFLLPGSLQLGLLALGVGFVA